ncbi:MAG: hypothetical protein C4520_10450 [Candidatus Abyssobacteria bacterium SURF_5]|uniref:Porin n=1 Tax=Abyssobacteria bacterium (strain SURF_5) TaxID=2093360 RepID=A0A3A4NQD8_ABYX5|nr:MAG: hypothetical protein C4520_10450 [Candidatus Abyssubacteria bacterium SURF_5]
MVLGNTRERKGERMKKVVLFLTIAVAGFLLAPAAWAENEEDIEALKQQLLQMQQQMQQQEMKIQQQDRKIMDLEAKEAPEAYVNMEEIVARVQEKVAPQDGFTIGKGKIKLTPYGFIRLDAAYDDSAVFMFSGNVVGWAWPEDGRSMAPVYPATFVHRDDDDQFSMTATATRLGLNFDGPEFAGGTIKGKIEIDFDELSGNGGDVVAHRIRMRHAYAELLYPTWSFLAGQTWDVVAPRIPPMLDCVVLWGSGNVGYRRPQLRLTKWWDVDGTKFTGQASLNHTDRSMTNDDFDGDLLLNGVESGYPMGEARIGMDTIILGERKLSLGLSGLLAREQTEARGDITQSENLDVWMVALDGSITIIPNLLSLQGEIWTGENIDNVYGGIVQGFVNVGAAPAINLKEIQATGGFIHAALTPRPDLQFNFGYGLDDADSEDMMLGNISQNWTVFANTIWTVVPNFDVGLELAWHETKWVDQADGDDFRVQTAFIYKF